MVTWQLGSKFPDKGHGISGPLFYSLLLSTASPSKQLLKLTLHAKVLNDIYHQDFSPKKLKLELDKKQSVNFFCELFSFYQHMELTRATHTPWTHRHTRKAEEHSRRTLIKKNPFKRNKLDWIEWNIFNSNSANSNFKNKFEKWSYTNISIR